MGKNLYRAFETRLAEAKGLSPDDCWRWQGTLTNDGYGLVTVGDKKKLAHRLSYTFFVGPIPDGQEIDHLCRTRNCVNPAHLEPVTHRENVLRGEGLAAQNARKTHCIHGHALSGDNVYVKKSGKRQCRTCKRESTNASYRIPEVREKRLRKGRERYSIPEIRDRVLKRQRDKYVETRGL